MGKTFKELSNDNKIEKEVKKVGLSLGIIFSKEELHRFNIRYGSIVILDNAEVENPKDI